MRIGKGKGSGWYIIDQNDKQVVNQTMNLKQLAEKHEKYLNERE